MVFTGHHRVGWPRAERELLVRSATRAEVLCPERPWVFELHDREIRLFELLTGESRDRAGLDRLLSCGAALAALHLAMRALGRQVEISFPADPDHPDLVAVLRQTGWAPPTGAESMRFAALDGTAPAALARVHLTATGPWQGVELRPLRSPSEATELARVLLADGPLPRDLRRWLPERHLVTMLVGGSAPEADVDLVCEVGARILRDRVLLALTTDDGRRDHVRAGAAVQWAVLGARALGCAARPVTVLSHRPEMRAALAAGLDLAGYPQVLLRVTDPASAADQVATAGADLVPEVGPAVGVDPVGCAGT